MSFRKGVRRNYDLFMELVDETDAAGSRVEGSDNLLKARAFGGEKIRPVSDEALR